MRESWTNAQLPTTWQTRLVYSKCSQRLPINFNAGGSSNFAAGALTALAAAMIVSCWGNFVNADFGVDERRDFEKAGAMTSATATRSRDETGIRMVLD